jgi:hypothetical protein
MTKPCKGKVHIAPNGERGKGQYGLIGLSAVKGDCYKPLTLFIFNA